MILLDVISGLWIIHCSLITSPHYFHTVKISAVALIKMVSVSVSLLD